MLYIIDEREDAEDKQHVLGQLGPSLWVLGLSEQEGIPAWKEFLETGKADAELVEKMKLECPIIGGTAGSGYRVILDESIPPIYVAED